MGARVPERGAPGGHHHLVATGVSGSTYRWTPALAAGTYTVHAWWVADNKAASNVPYTIHNSGLTDVIPVDHTASGGQLGGAGHLRLQRRRQSFGVGVHVKTCFPC